MSKSPGIISRTKFIAPSDRRYKKAIDYIDRSQAVRGKSVEDWHIFSSDKALHIKNNEGRITTMFTDQQDYVNKETKYQLKETFSDAQENGSPMWQTVFSFDNEYLKELGLLKESFVQELHEDTVRKATRLAVKKMCHSMNLGTNVSWAGAIHYNTDNIHVHIMMVLPEPEGILPKMTFKDQEVYRGKIPPETVRQMKSVFANSVENREPSLVRISYLMREELAKNLTQPHTMSQDNILMRRLNQLRQRLPKDTRTWQYNHSEFAPYKKELDEITSYLMATHQPHILKELDALLKEQTAFYLRVYGENSPEGNQGKLYRDNKLSELNAMVGNAVLRELKQTDTHPTHSNKLSGTLTFHDHSTKIVTQKDLYNIKGAVRETQQDFLNQRAYEREQYRKERQREYEQENGLN